MFGYCSKLFTSRAPAADDKQRISGYSSATQAFAPQPSKEEVFKAVGTFYYKPYAAQSYERISSEDGAVIEINRTGSKVFSLRVMEPEESKDEPTLEQPVTAAMELTFHHETGAVMWRCVFDGALRDVCFRFKGRGADSRTFVAAFNTCVYASLVDNSKVEAEDIDYVKSTYTREQPMREASPSPVANDDASQQDELFTFDGRERSVAPRLADEGKAGTNFCFADSVANGRVIVLRKSAGKSAGMEARAYAYDSRGDFSTNSEAFSLEEAMGKLTLREGKDNQTLLANDEKNMMALHKGGGIVDIDLVQGQVVTEYKGPEKFEPTAITYRSKFADNDPNLICCLANNVAYSIDRRSKNVVTEDGKGVDDYCLTSLRQPMLCHATSAKGQLVIGDSAGDIRLYTGPPGTARTKGHHPKTAKTLLKGAVGKPIVSIDITADGKFAVAATSDAILLFPLEFLDGDEVKNGCDVRMGQSKKKPLRLVPTAEQAAAMGGAAAFTSVRFDADKNAIGDDSAQWIVAVSGTSILTWKMASVVKALASQRAVLSDAVREDADVRQIDMRSAGRVTFMTKDAVGTEKRSDKPVRKGFSYFI